MESKHQRPSVILKLMGLDEVPRQHPVGDRQKVLSEKYLQSVACIGVRKKRTSCQHHSSRMSTIEKDEYEDASKVVKTIRRDKLHNPSEGNEKETPYLSEMRVKGVQQQLLDASYVSVGRRRETLVDAISLSDLQTSVDSGKQWNVTEKLEEVGWYRYGSTLHQFFSISRHGNGVRNFSDRSGFSEDKIRSNVRCKVGVNYGFYRKVATTRPLCTASVIADNQGAMTKDNLFQRYWGLRKNAHSNWSTKNSLNQNINQKQCSEDMNLMFSSEKSPSFSSYFNSNHIEEDCDLHKLKKRCYENDFSDKKPMHPQLSRAGPSPTFIDSQILQETRLMDDEVKHNMHEDSNMSNQYSASDNSSVDCLVSDAQNEVVDGSNNNPTRQQPESTAFVLFCGDSDSFSHASYASMQQDASEFQEGSVYSLCSGTEPDFLGCIEDAYEPSPVSVLDRSFREDDISSSSAHLKVDGASMYDSSEEDDEEFGLNVSSNEDCGDESEGDLKGKRDLVGLFSAEESRDFSYVVEVLAEAGSSNRSLFTDFSAWHSAECPISPSVFEILEKKFGQQQLWKRSERWLLFDRINFGLFEILQPCSYIPTWEKLVSRRLNAESCQDMIEEIWVLLVAQEKGAGKEMADKLLGGEVRWVEVGDDIENIVREIVTLLMEELADEAVTLENF